MLSSKVYKRLAFEIYLWPVHSSKDDTKCAKITCLDAVIGGHSKFLLVRADCCRKRLQLLSCLLRKALRNEPVQLGAGAAVPVKIPFWQASFWRYSYLWSFYWLCVSFRFSPQGFRPHGNASHKKCAKSTCLDTTIRGHSRFLLVTGDCCRKR